ncbi:MAG: HlyD family efflux transporter periplasmic adaptor subunit [Acidobacteria bacterium]|nr:HlyD family efflux transporter periplasmic adaptor subunit [Acidobacteriota bacterium]
MKRAIIVVVLLAVVAAGAGAWYLRRERAEVAVNSVPVTRGDIIDTVGATGTVQAVTTVQVGSQVSGNIEWLGADFNSIVRKGQVVARLDPSLFDAQLRQVQANLSQARANLTRANSELDRTKVQLTDAQQKHARALELSSRSLIAQSDLDSAKIAVDSAVASVASQQASVTQSQAAVTQAEASVNQSQVNRDHTVIKAPIDGIVTQRSVDVGQTVAASMSAPTLFVIAADLTEMQVNANIDEADVGRIRPGQHVTFRVDAYPTDNFQGTVTQIRLQPVVVQNVTTYGTVITVPNQQLKLKPGMTANVKIEIAKRTNTLRIANAALRFRPTTEMFAAFNQTPPPEATGFGGRGGMGGGQRPSEGATIPPPPAAPPASAPAAPAAPAARVAPAAPDAPAATADGAGRGGRGGRGGGGNFEGRGGAGGGFAGRGPGGPGGAGGADFQARMLERFKTMPAEERTQFLARMKERGGDTSAFEALMAPQGRAPRTGAPRTVATPQAQTIDALFAPLPRVESRGRTWVFTDKELKVINIRLGISDGTNTELVSDELQEGTEVVTGVTGLTPARGAPAQGGAANPLMPGGRGGRGPGSPGGGGRGGF